jgi:4-amino-4-deoxy-L-arabinose transferase-like glycosyltransferase
VSGNRASGGARAPRPFLGGWHLLLPIVVLAAARGLWAPDEPRYAQIAREAYEQGSLLVLHLCGDLYPDKPPLVYWLAGLCGKLAAWHELALRLPSILATAGSAWLCGRMARRHLGAVAGDWAPTFFLGGVLVLWVGCRLQLDPVLSFLCLAAVDRLWRDASDRAQRRRDAWAAGALAGLAGLAKGPVAWVHVGLALVAARFVPRAVRAPLRIPGAGWAGMALLAVAPVALWATAAALQDPRLWRPLFLGQHLGRAADPDAPHSGPPWEHAVELPAYLLPWTPLVLAGLALAWRSWRAARRGDASEGGGLLRATLWFALVLAFFSAIPPKREVYLLPVYPVTAWLAAAAFQRALERGRLARWVGAGVALVLLCAGLGAAAAPYAVEGARPLGARGLWVAVPPAAGGVAALLCLRRGNVARWADAVSLAVAAAGVAAAVVVVPWVDARKSARPLAEVVAARPERPQRIPCLGVQPEGFRFYGGVPTVRRTPGLSAEDELAAALQREGAQLLVLVRDTEWERLAEPVRARFTVLEHRPVGGREVLLVGAAR